MLQNKVAISNQKTSRTVFTLETQILALRANSSSEKIPKCLSSKTTRKVTSIVDLQKEFKELKLCMYYHPPKYSFTFIQRLTT